MCATAARLARFAGKAYVLPRTGQRGIPVVSVNTPSVKVQIYRVGDRNLLNSVSSEDFQRNLGRYELDTSGRRTRRAGVEGRSRGRIPAQRRRDDGVSGHRGGRRSRARRLCHVGGAGRAVGGRLQRAGDAMVHRLGPRRSRRIPAMTVCTSMSIRWRARRASPMSRSGLSRATTKCSATRKTDANGYAAVRAGLARGEGGSSPALLVVSEYAAAITRSSI